MNETSSEFDIKGYEKISMVDYPGKISSVIFFGKCNLRCPYCYNIQNLAKAQPLHLESILREISSVRNKIDAIVLTGGEPLYHKITLFPLILELRVQFPDKLLKLDTNGLFPEDLQSLLEQKLIDFVAMDIKTVPKKYMLLGAKVEDCMSVERSVKIIQQSKVDHHFRTTLAKFVTKEDLQWIKQIVGESSWKIQKEVV